MLIVLLLLPVPIAERYTSPTQDGRYVLDPLRAYGFIITLVEAAGGAALTSSGKALAEAKSVFVDGAQRPLKVELLYLSDTEPYVYVTRGGYPLRIASPPRLVWEVWGRDVRGDPRGPVEVIGFLDYVSGRPLGTSDPVVLHRPADYSATSN